MTEPEPKPGPWGLYPMDMTYGGGKVWYVSREKVSGKKDQESFGPFDRDTANLVLGNLTRPLEHPDPCEACAEAYYRTLCWARTPNHEGFMGLYHSKSLEAHHQLIQRLLTNMRAVTLQLKEVAP